MNKRPTTLVPETPCVTPAATVSVRGHYGGFPNAVNDPQGVSVGASKRTNAKRDCSVRCGVVRG